MNFKTTLQTSYSAIGSSFKAVETVAATVNKTAQYAEQFMDEALEVQAETKSLRVKQAVIEAKRDLAQSFTGLSDADKAAIQAIADL